VTYDIGRKVMQLSRDLLLRHFRLALADVIFSLVEEVEFGKTVSPGFYLFQDSVQAKAHFES
jgi:hypothetical protein